LQSFSKSEATDNLVTEKPLPEEKRLQNKISVSPLQAIWTITGNNYDQLKDFILYFIGGNNVSWFFYK
jgi:hypothetical protein